MRLGHDQCQITSEDSLFYVTQITSIVLQKAYDKMNDHDDAEPAGSSGATVNLK